MNKVICTLLRAEFLIEELHSFSLICCFYKICRENSFLAALTF